MKFKFAFHISLLALIAFEIYRAYLVLPFPGSQEAETVTTAYFLYHYRWIFRIVLFAGMVFGFVKAFEKRKWIAILMLSITGFVVYVTNFLLTAQSHFHEPENLAFVVPSDGKIPMDALVLGVTIDGESKAYPIRYLSFHHQVRDQVGKKKVMVTYCDVCRSGIVFDPIVDGKEETFRLVGMDLFNAMFEDNSTGSWWRQANGEAVAGSQKGKSLNTINSEQLTLAEWYKRHPNGVVMLPDPLYATKYATDAFEKGTDTDELTKTDTASWQDKSWVIGIECYGKYKAYDWNQLKKERIIYDTIGKQHIVLTIDSTNINYFAYKIPERKTLGLDLDSPLMRQSTPVGFGTVEPLNARQLFWHTWKTFYPTTTQYSTK